MRDSEKSGRLIPVLADASAKLDVVQQARTHLQRNFALHID